MVRHRQRSRKTSSSGPPRQIRSARIPPSPPFGYPLHRPTVYVISSLESNYACKSKAAERVAQALANLKTASIMDFSECLNFSGPDSENNSSCGCSSVARASRCQRECRRFESDHPLSFAPPKVKYFAAKVFERARKGFHLPLGTPLTSSFDLRWLRLDGNAIRWHSVVLPASLTPSACANSFARCEGGILNFHFRILISPLFC